MRWTESCHHLKLELLPGDAKTYFASRWKWTEEQIAIVAAQGARSLWACPSCKLEYRMSRFPELQWGNDLDGDQDAPEDGDFATEVGAMAVSSGGKNHVHIGVNLYWYGAGVFPKGPVNHRSRNRRKTWYTCYEINGRMLTQQRIDKIRYLRDNNNSLEGYKRRFVFGYSLRLAFEKADKEELRAPMRPPIGLNPERFAIQCVRCEGYVYRAEHSDAGKIVCAACRHSDDNSSGGGSNGERKGHTLFAEYM